MLKLVMKLYTNLIRSWLSPALYWILRWTKYRGELPDEWDKVKDLSVDDFHKEIAIRDSYEYKFDLLGGAIDFSPQEENFFFLDKKSSRDCDDWARMWYWYLKHNNYKEITEITLWNVTSLKDMFKNGLAAHKVTVAKVDNKYQLFDYRPVSNKEDSIEEVLQHNQVGYNNFVWAKYKEKPYLIFIIIGILLLVIL